MVLVVISQVGISTCSRSSFSRLHFKCCLVHCRALIQRHVVRSIPGLSFAISAITLSRISSVISYSSCVALVTYSHLSVLSHGASLLKSVSVFQRPPQNFSNFSGSGTSLTGSLPSPFTVRNTFLGAILNFLFMRRLSSTTSCHSNFCDSTLSSCFNIACMYLRLGVVAFPYCFSILCLIIFWLLLNFCFLLHSIKTNV